MSGSGCTGHGEASGSRELRRAPWCVWTGLWCYKVQSFIVNVIFIKPYDINYYTAVYRVCGVRRSASATRRGLQLRPARVIGVELEFIL